MASCSRCRVFLDEVMFASYDVVLHYDRSRGVRATRGAADWGDWLQQVARPRDSTNAVAAARAGFGARADRPLPAAHAQPAARLPAAPKAPERGSPSSIEFAEFVVPRGDALPLGGPFAANVVKVLGWANDPAIAQANIVTVLISRGAERSERAGRREPARGRAACPAAGRSGDAELPPGARQRREFPDAGGEVRSADRDARRRGSPA